MNRYQPAVPRAALGLTAIIIAAMTMGALVVLPAKLDAREHGSVDEPSADACVAYHQVSSD